MIEAAAPTGTEDAATAPTADELWKISSLLFPGLAHETGNSDRAACIPGGWNLTTDLVVDDYCGPSLMVEAWTPKTGLRSVAVVHSGNFHDGSWKATFHQTISHLLDGMAEDHWEQSKWNPFSGWGRDEFIWCCAVQFGFTTGVLLGERRPPYGQPHPALDRIVDWLRYSTRQAA